MKIHYTDELAVSDYVPVQVLAVHRNLTRSVGAASILRTTECVDLCEVAALRHEASVVFLKFDRLFLLRHS